MGSGCRCGCSSVPSRDPARTSSSAGTVCDVRVGPLLEHSRLDGVDADDVVEEVDQVLYAQQPLDIAAQNDAIPAAIDELDSLAQDCRQSLHGMIQIGRASCRGKSVDLG